MKLLDELFEAVSTGLRNGTNLEKLAVLLSRYDGIDWKPYKYFTASHYTRYTYRLNDMLDMIIFCWEPGQVCPVHDLPAEGCMIRMLQGELQITTYDLMNLPEVLSLNLLRGNDVITLPGASTGNEIKNVSGKRAVSLHLCAPPNFRPNYF